MAEVASAFVTLVPSFKGGAAAIAKELDGPADRAGRQAGARTRKGFASTFGGGSLIPTAAIAAGVAGLGVLTKGAIDAAGAAEQSIGATQSIFGKNADTIIKKSNEAATAVGLDANAYRESANLIGAQLGNMGLAADDVAKKTQGLVTKGADLASMFGGTTQEAVGALSSALKGEFDPLERYGISLNATKVNAELAARGQDKLTGKALDAAKANVLLSMVQKQSAKATGNFARESDTLAGKQERLKAQFKNVQTTVGNMLLPAMSGLLTNVQKIVPKIESFISGMQTGEGAGGKFASALKSVGEWLGKAWDFAVKYQSVLMPIAAGMLAGVAAFKVLVAVARAYTAVQTVLNVVLSANPIGIVIIALVALGAGLVVAYKKSETFRKIVQGAWEAIGNAARFVWNNVVAPVIRFLLAAFSNVTRFYATMLRGLSKVPGFGWAKKAADALDGAARKADQLRSSVNSIPDRKTINVDIYARTRQTGRITLPDGSKVNVGMREHGGPVRKGQPYIVGEKRPELFVPKTDGYIVPRVPDNATAYGANGAPLVGSLTIQSSGNVKDDLDEALWKLRRIRRGGIYA